MSAVSSPLSAVIDTFSGAWDFLANSYPVTVRLDGRAYPSVEHAYQASRVRGPALRALIAATPDPRRACQLAASHPERADWQEARVVVMRQLVEQKFHEPTLRERTMSLPRFSSWPGAAWTTSPPSPVRGCSASLGVCSRTSAGVPLATARPSGAWRLPVAVRTPRTVPCSPIAGSKKRWRTSATPTATRCC